MAAPLAPALPPAGVYKLHAMVRPSDRASALQRDWRFVFELHLPADGGLTWDAFVRRELRRKQLRPCNKALLIGLVDYKRYLGGAPESDRNQKSDMADWPKVFADDHRRWGRDFVKQKHIFEVLGNADLISNVFREHSDLQHEKNYILFITAAKVDVNIPAPMPGGGPGAVVPPAPGAAPVGAVGAGPAHPVAAVAHALEYDPRGSFRSKLTSGELTALDGLIQRMRDEFQPHDTRGAYTTAHRRLQQSEEYLGDVYNKQQLGTFPPSKFVTRLSAHAAVVCSLWIELEGDDDNVAMGFVGTGFMVSPQYMQTALHNLYVIPKNPPLLPSDFKPRTSCPIHCCFEDDADGNMQDNPNKYYSFKYNSIGYPENHDKLQTLQFDVALVDLAGASARNKVFLDGLVTPENCIRLLPRAPKVRFADTRALPADRSQRVFILGFPDTRSAADQAREQFANGKVERLVSLNRNTIVGYDLGWQVFYSIATRHGLSGAPGLFLDGRLACMHREGGVQHFGEGWSKSFFATGVRMDLFVRDAFGHDANELPRRPRVDATVAAVWTAIKKFYTDHP